MGSRPINKAIAPAPDVGCAAALEYTATSDMTIKAKSVEDLLIIVDVLLY